MLALSPQGPHLFSTMGWQEEDNISHVLNTEEAFASHTPKETETSYQSLGLSPTQPEFELDDLQNSTLSPTQAEFELDDLQNSTFSIRDPSNPTRKLNHNAYERDRRKKLNTLYSSLRSLLPETDQSKKLSIPSTVSRVLKYIPELQRQVEKLTRRKEEILLMVSRQEEHGHNSTGGIIYPIVSATCLNNKEVMLQICFLHKAVCLPFSKVLRVLEGEGLQLMNASTFTTHADKTFYTLHLQARESRSIECQIFCEHLIKTIREQAALGSIRHCM
ncbi:protein IRON-RELATED TRANSCRIPTION FACTOR 2 isoform X2 [Elaeis guineensis]|uniref:Protein IRON-RELATED TRANSCRIPTION FACTOR 2 n=1 Tax=Elaeis guineensis var. tenera TaxID=51953 RepID=A0A6I9RIW8_ELAGV|nr:protein IRON-RELATED TRANSCRIPTION FACTOR 2 isoform X2 [Elaeis guineensis]